MSIASDSEVTQFLTAGLSSTTTALITTLHQQAEQAILDYLGLDAIEQATYVEYYPMEQSVVIQQPDDPSYVLNAAGTKAVPVLARPSQILQLKNLPVRSITEIREDPNGFFGQPAGAFPSSTILTAGTDYFLKTEKAGISWSGQVMRRAYWWPMAPGSTMVTYVAGFTSGEFSGRYSVFKAAVFEETSERYLRSMSVGLGQRPDMASEGQGGGVTASYRDNHESGACVCDRVAEMLQGYVSYGQYAP